MRIINNRYETMGKTLEELSKEYIMVDCKNRKLEDLDIGLELPNVLYYIETEETGKVDFINIFSSVRVLVTDYWTLINNYNKIPEYVEYIVGNNKIYRNNRDKRDFIEYEKDIKEREEIIRRWIEEDVNYVNIEGQTVLIYALLNNMKEEVKKILMSNFECINRKNIYDRNILYYVSISSNDEIKRMIMEDKRIDCYDEYEGESSIISRYLSDNFNREYLDIIIERVTIETVMRYIKRNVSYEMKYIEESIIRKLFNKLGEKIKDEELRMMIEELRYKKDGYNKKKIKRLIRIYYEIRDKKIDFYNN